MKHSITTHQDQTYLPAAKDAAQEYGQIKTRDIFHAAYLITRGMAIKQILPDTTGNRSKAIFVIGGQGIKELEEEYRSGSVLVNIFSLKESIQRTKDVMFDFLRTSGLSY